MSAWLDTNVLIRRLTGDPPEQAARATRLFARAERLLLADLIVAEVVYVLESFYEVPRPGSSSWSARSSHSPPSGSWTSRSCSAPWRSTRCTASTSPPPTWSPTPRRVDAVVSFDKAIERVPTVRRVEP